MPPSGYNYDQAAAVCDFLRSCVAALILENRGLRTAPQSVIKEILSIQRDFDTNNRAPFEHHLLGVTQAFYKALSENCPEDLEALPEHAEAVLGDFSQRVLEIHVDDRTPSNTGPSAEKQSG